MSLLSPIRRLTTHRRRLVARHPRLRWLPVVAASLAVVASVATHQRRSVDVRDAWGTTTAVWIATDDLGPGAPLAVERRDVPLALAFDGALAADARPEEYLVRQQIVAGSIVAAVDVAQGDGLDALIPAGWRGVAIEESPSSGARVGDRVDVVSDGVVLASDALVADRRDGVVVVAVPSGSAPLVALAGRTGVALLRVPAGES